MLFSHLAVAFWKSLRFEYINKSAGWLLFRDGSYNGMTSSDTTAAHVKDKWNKFANKLDRKESFPVWIPISARLSESVILLTWNVQDTAYVDGESMCLYVCCIRNFHPKIYYNSNYFLRERERETKNELLLRKCWYFNPFYCMKIYALKT